MEELLKVLWEMFGAEKMEKKNLSLPGQKRIAHILPLIITALNDEERRKILAFLLKDRNIRFLFWKIGKEFPLIKRELLSNHLQILQKAWMVNRTADLSDPIMQEHPYYSFYQISDFGLEVLDCLADFLVMIEKDYLSKK